MVGALFQAPSSVTDTSGRLRVGASMSRNNIKETEAVMDAGINHLATPAAVSVAIAPLMASIDSNVLRRNISGGNSMS
jgi:hypothetical protein